MRGKIIVNGIEISKNKTSICVPIVQAEAEGILNMAQRINKYKVDLIEWRADYFECAEEAGKVNEILCSIRRLTDKPLIFTYRGAAEGGFIATSDKLRAEVALSVIEKNLPHMVDIELNNEKNILSELVNAAHKNNIYVVMSNHDFEKTPSPQEIIERLLQMESLGADIAKIAVMPRGIDDVILLLDALNQANKIVGIPITAISMGKLGLVSRVAANVFGSCITFGNIGGESAPGQIRADKLRSVMGLFE
ncbi:MAG: type I 3-dehydroquinate dehydratase [Clostridiales bacterium]|jgi:3-dehydroquinate dehydratase-1|nr:type I 3-dehydroquinate dehydratase [Clostridiales bacterium]